MPLFAWSVQKVQCSYVRKYQYVVIAETKDMDVPRFSPILHAPAVHEVTAPKKGPHKQSSSVFGSQPATTAASFQQFICRSLLVTHLVIIS